MTIGTYNALTESVVTLMGMEDLQFWIDSVDLEAIVKIHLTKILRISTLTLNRSFASISFVIMIVIRENDFMLQKFDLLNQILKIETESPLDFSWKIKKILKIFLKDLNKKKSFKNPKKSFGFTFPLQEGFMHLKWLLTRGYPVIRKILTNFENLI